ncbi:hypothetical protein NPIL_375581 [Nephila pilipes]|uniref:Uncharacterized protein n=1 Tax=Nephila pilipes TaxID=299642 RepID=A0A8X6MVK3_NEPPI|nr:hypothetical protein NPIL_375581 [Nephila pilipes]
MASSDAAFENCPFFETPFGTFKEERERDRGEKKEETGKRHDTAIFLKETSSPTPVPSIPTKKTIIKKGKIESSGVLALRDSSEIWKFSGTLGVTGGRMGGREDASCSLSTQTPPLPPGTEEGEEK